MVEDEYFVGDICIIEEIIEVGILRNYLKIKLGVI